jgi:hypothetical protein
MQNMRNGGCYFLLQKKLELSKLNISETPNKHANPPNSKISDSLTKHVLIKREEEESTCRLFPTFAVKHAKVPMLALFL